MNLKFLFLTEKLTHLFSPNPSLSPEASASQTINPISLEKDINSEIYPVRSFKTYLNADSSLFDKYQKAKTDNLLAPQLPIESETILAHLETDFKTISTEKLNIRHILRLKNLTEIVLPRIFKEYSEFKTKKTDNGIPADLYFVENLKIAARQVKEILGQTHEVSIDYTKHYTGNSASVSQTSAAFQKPKF